MLSLDYRRELKRLRKVLRGPNDDDPLTWEEIVEDARDTLEYNHLTPEDATHKIQGFNKPEITAPEEGQIALGRDRSDPSVRSPKKSLFSTWNDDAVYAN